MTMKTKPCKEPCKPIHDYLTLFGGNMNFALNMNTKPFKEPCKTIHDYLAFSGKFCKLDIYLYIYFYSLIVQSAKKFLCPH